MMSESNVINLSKTFKSMEESIEQYTLKENIHWEYDNKFLTAYRNKDCKKNDYIYYIEKKTCKTRERRFVWLLHMSG